MSLGALGSLTGNDRWLAAGGRAIWEEAQVVAVTRAASGAVLRLRLAEVPKVLPGQYYLLRLALDSAPGVVEQAYSLCSSPYPPTPEVEIAVGEIPGGRLSSLLARRVEVGDLLHVRGPFGFLTWTERDGGPVGLIGAGSGVAPLTSIVRYAAARRATVPMTLLSSSRDRRSALLSEPLEALADDEPWFRLARSVTRDPGDRMSSYHRRVDSEMLDEVFTAAPPARRPTVYFVAGPGEMVIAVRAMLSALDVAENRIFSEDHA